jgi:hypothetical protein
MFVKDKIRQRGSGVEICSYKGIDLDFFMVKDFYSNLR